MITNKQINAISDSVSPEYVANFKGDILKSNLNELLPYAFKAGELLD